MAGGRAWAKRPRSPDEIESVAISLAHPVRSKLMNFLAMKPGAGVSELAEWSRGPIRGVRRHLSILVEQGLVEVQGHENRRGVAKRYYRNAVEPVLTEEAEAGLSERDRRLVTLGILRLIFNEATESLSAGVLTARADRVVANTPGEVDEQGWEELARLHRELLERTQVLIAESRGRLESSGEDPIAILSSLVFVERPALRPSSRIAPR